MLTAAASRLLVRHYNANCPTTSIDIYSRDDDDDGSQEGASTSKSVHLYGVRREQEVRPSSRRRRNPDKRILLTNCEKWIQSCKTVLIRQLDIVAVSCSRFGHRGQTILEICVSSLFG